VHPNLTSLEIVDLSGNWMNAFNPTYWFWQAATTRHLDLTNNMAGGPFPDAVAIMTSLEVLRLGGNQLSDVVKGLEPLTGRTS
jgi:Leucine-rich repeat (LRR) protein